MFTLHGYVLRELLKTFALTLIALTALFTMGGGLYNVLKYEGIGATDLLALFPLLIPIVLTLTMPVAALFAATMVYGRLAADNELLACRAAGVNIHRLFLSALLLAVFVAGFTVLFGDLVIPDFLRRMDQFARTNLRDIAFSKMQVMGNVRYEKIDENEGKSGQRYLLTAHSVKLPTKAALEEQHLPTTDGISYLVIEEPVFLQIGGSDQGDMLIRYAAAHQGLCQFDARTTPLEMTIFVDDGRDFDLSGRHVRLKQQQLGPITIPLEFPRKASMVDLGTLLRWRKRPWEVDRLKPDVREFLVAVKMERFFVECGQRVAERRPVSLVDERGQTWEITAGGVHEDEKGLALTDARVFNRGAGGSRPLYYDAPVVVLKRSMVLGGQMAIELHLRESPDHQVIEHNPRASDYEKGRPKSSLVVPASFEFPDTVLAEMQRYTEAAVFDPAFQPPLSPRLAEKRTKLLDSGAMQRRKMSSVIHFRLGFSSSVLVTVVMAAALGVIFRGARALAAFGLACIPFGTVALLMVMARQLAEKPGAEMLGPLLTWGGLAAVGLIDVGILRLGVRR